MLQNLLLCPSKWTAIVKARGKKTRCKLYCSWKLIKLLWPHDRTQLDMDFLLCLGRFFLSWTFSSIAQYEDVDGRQPQKVECGSIWKNNKTHLSSFQFRSNWKCSIVLIGDHSCITSTYFWNFFVTHPLCQHKYSTKHQKKIADPTHPVLLLT